MRRQLAFATMAVGMLAPGMASAYIGPGAGLSAIGSAVAFLGVLILLIAGFVWYPARRLVRRLRGGATDGRTGGAAGGAAASGEAAPAGRSGA